MDLIIVIQLKHLDIFIYNIYNIYVLISTFKSQ